MMKKCGVVSQNEGGASNRSSAPPALILGQGAGGWGKGCQLHYNHHSPFRFWRERGPSPLQQIFAQRLRNRQVAQGHWRSNDARVGEEAQRFCAAVAAPIYFAG